MPTPSRDGRRHTPPYALAAALVAVAALASLAVWQATRAPSATPEIQAAWDNLNACREQTEERDRVFAERDAALRQAIQDATPHIAYTTNLRLHPDGRQALYAFRDILWARDGVARARNDSSKPPTRKPRLSRDPTRKAGDPLRRRDTAPLPPHPGPGRRARMSDPGSPSADSDPSSLSRCWSRVT